MLVGCNFVILTYWLLVSVAFRYVKDAIFVALDGLSGALYCAYFFFSLFFYLLFFHPSSKHCLYIYIPSSLSGLPESADRNQHPLLARRSRHYSYWRDGRQTHTVSVNSYNK